MQRALLVVVVLVGCKEKSKAVPVDPPPVKPQVSEADFRVKSSLDVAEQDGAFVISDGAKRMKLTLPARPTLSGDLVAQSGVEVFNAQAVMQGGSVDVQFGAMTVRDGDLPPEMLTMIGSAPQQLAQAAGGTIARNETGTLAGTSARIFELTTPDKRRLFGWYVMATAHGRMYQINCVGNDTPATSAACHTIAKSLALTP